MPQSAIEVVVENLEKLRARKPLVHCLTNQVVKGFTANALLAIGAAPAMVEHPEEAAAFAGVADALLINVGTIEPLQIEAIRAAAPAAREAGRPWVLDPVAVGFLSVRTALARELMEQGPSMVRGNASEIMALAGFEARGRGVESGDESTAAREAALELVRKGARSVLVSGRVDLAFDRDRSAAVANGHALMTRVTGVGCAMGAIAAAFCAVAADPFDAAVSTAVVLGLAGEIAAGRASRPGSFQIELLDALDAVDGETIRRLGRLQ